MGVKKTARERFEEKCEPVTESGCLIWTGAAMPKGYGVFWLDGKHVGAHRAAWEMEKGPIPDGLHVLHHCDNPSCVNTNHLFLGTGADNTADMLSKGRAKGNHKCIGDKNNRTKLKAEDIPVIRKRLEVDIAKDIAADYGVEASTINAIRRKETWRHVQ